MPPIMSAMADPRYRRVVAVLASQMGKTEGFWNVIGWRLDDDPTPILYVAPTQKLAESMSSDRVMKMLRSVPSLWQKLEKGKKNKITEKFIGGVRLGFAWAGSATELAGHPAGLVLIDERDRMTASAGMEGDPVELAEARTATYPDGKIAVVSTPTDGNVGAERNEQTGVEHWQVTEDIPSPIWRLWQEGTRAEWAVPCPECGDYFVPRLKHLHYPRDAGAPRAAKEARLACVNCGALIESNSMHRMNAAGRYICPGQRVEKDGTITGEAPQSETASFWVSGLCSPWRSFAQRTRSYVSAVKSCDPERIRAVVNTAFGELYSERGEAPPLERVLDLRSDYRMGDVPGAKVILTAGVDVQKNRLIAEVRAWGSELSSWVILFEELWGQADQPEVWDRLADLLHDDYSGFRIRRMMIDSGYLPDKVYAFCRMYPEQAFASKGHDSLSIPVRAAKIDVTPRGETRKYSQQLWHIDASYFKAMVHARLNWPQDQPGAWRLPSDIPEEYAKQLLAESRVLLPSGKYVWKRHDKDNHALDCAVLNCAAARIIGIERASSRPAASAQPKRPARIVRGGFR